MKPIRVVVADDNDEMSTMIEIYLDDPRFEVVAKARDGEEAIRVVQREQPDAIVLDMSMPEMDGVHAIPEITNCSPDTKIVVLSGMPIQTEPLISQGAVAHLHKHVDIPRLRSTLIDVCSDDERSNDVA